MNKGCGWWSSIIIVAVVVAAPLASAYPTPGFNGEESKMVLGRVFPEARQTNDYVSYHEARAGLEILEEDAPELIEVVDVARSVGWVSSVSGEREPHPVFAAIVTDESTAPPDGKTNLVFQLSIHGNEKGAREGGLRVIEDLVLAHRTSEDVHRATQDRLEMLERQRLIFIFANPDGWLHEEPEYRHNEACSVTSPTCQYDPGGRPGETGGPGVEAQGFVRVNGNGTDLNRQAPVAGYIANGEAHASALIAEADHRTLEEPEPYGIFTWLKDRFDRIHYSSDIHGMIHPADGSRPNAEDDFCAPTDDFGKICTRTGHFVLGMLPAGSFGPSRHARELALAQKANGYLNEAPEFETWRTMPSTGFAGGEVATWGTVWETIGHTDTGYTGDWYAQEHGLDAVSVGYELAYNHLANDNRYAATGAEMNRLHIGATRAIVAAFMDFASDPHESEVVPGEAQVGYVPTDVVETPPEDRDLPPRKRAFAVDDYRASPNGFFRDLQIDLQDASALQQVPPQALQAGTSEVDTLIVPGSAGERLEEEDVATIKGFVEDGGRLVLTDRSLTLLSDLGIEADADVIDAYVGYVNPDRDHALMEDVPGFGRQLVEPVPLGYRQGEVPMWTLSSSAVQDAGGSVAGTTSDQDRAVVGQVPVGEGDVVFVGSLLPDPFTGHSHPYRLVDHSVGYAGHQILRNAVGWELVQTDGGTGSGGGPATPAGADAVPAPGTWVVLAAAGLAIGLRRQLRA